MNKIYEAGNNNIQKALILADDQSQDTSVKWNNHKISNEYIPYDLKMIDMGLSVLWAAYNIGAFPGQTAEGWYGNYYAWGETEPKNEYSEYNYYGNNEQCALLPDNDAATSLYATLRTPTVYECRELLENTNKKWVDNYNNIQGLSGMIFISMKNGNSIFIPAAGYYNDRTLTVDRQYCYIWTSASTGYEAHYLSISQKTTEIYTGDPWDGLNVRAVK